MAFSPPKFKNAAGRLCSIIQSIPKGKPWRETIPELFDCKPKGESEKHRASMRGLLEIEEVYETFLEELRDSEMPDATRLLFRQGLTSLERFVYPATVAGEPGELPQSEKVLLELAASMLPEEDDPPEGGIEQIQEAITRLQTIITDGSAPFALKKILLELVRIADDAIAKYNIRGAKGLKRAFKSMLAEVAEIYSIDDSEKETVKQSEAWKAIQRLLQVTDAVASVVLKYKPLLEYAAPLLLMGPN